MSEVIVLRSKDAKGYLSYPGIILQETLFELTDTMPEDCHKDFIAEVNKAAKEIFNKTAEELQTLPLTGFIKDDKDMQIYRSAVAANLAVSMFLTIVNMHEEIRGDGID